MKLGVITDGISQDAETAFRLLKEHGLEYAELQFVYGKEIGEQTPEEVKKIKDLIRQYDIKVSCITKHNFNGIPWDTPLDSDLIKKHQDGLKRCFALALEFECPLVRVMSCKKEMILFGANGAEKWVTKVGAWDAQLKIMEIPVRMAEKEGITLVAENENGGMITSNYLAAKIIEQLGSENLKILWDPCNTLYCTELPYPTGYERGQKYIRHLHIKDAKINIQKATVNFRSLGTGDMAPYLLDIAGALKRDSYEGVVSLEANYRPNGLDFVDGFKSSVDYFKRIFD